VDKLAEKIKDLYIEQLSSWELARVNYSMLEKVLVKELKFGDISVFVQFNPERIRSTAADTGAAAIGKRPCFLCEANRPGEQKGIDLKTGLTVLINPYPIFDLHLTIPAKEHTPQFIKGRFLQMLDLAAELPGYTIFYNGPRCGASAPDHFHFQACESNRLPVVKDFQSGKFITAIHDSGPDEVWLWHDYLRGILTLSGSSAGYLEAAFERFMNIFQSYGNEPGEPMINCLATYSVDRWTIHLIPRKSHRPHQYFVTGEERLLVSPASVDLGGVVIVPRQTDYDRLSEDLLSDVFAQVCFNDREMNQMISNFIG
jgi:hypothetical protein